MKTPDVTPTQYISAVAVAAAVVLSHLGWMTTDQFFGVCAVAGLHVGGDAVIRNGRAATVAAGHALAAAQVQSAPDARDGQQNAVAVTAAQQPSA